MGTAQLQCEAQNPCPRASDWKKQEAEPGCKWWTLYSFPFAPTVKVHAFRKTQECTNSAHCFVLSLPGRGGLCHHFHYFLLCRLTQTYVMIFIPALPVSFQGVRDPILGSLGEKWLGCHELGLM